MNNEWLKWLSNIPNPYGPYIRILWNNISKKINNSIIPNVHLTDDSFIFIWNIKEHHLELETYADGHAEWFYRNRIIENNDGDNIEISLELPDAFIIYLEMINNTF